MLNRKRSLLYSCSNLENATSTLEAPKISAPPRSLSTNDLSLELTLITPGIADKFTQGEDQLKTCSSGDDITRQFNHHNGKPENSSFPTEKSPSFTHGMTLFPHLFTESDQIQDLGRGFCDSSIHDDYIKRALSNREAAHRCQLRKQEYIEKLKRDVDAEEARLSMMSSQVSYYNTRCKILKMKNNEMTDKTAGLKYEKAIKQAESQLLMEELKTLGLAYMLPRGK